MLKLRYDHEQKTYHVGGIPIGGQPGQLPIYMWGNMFWPGDKLVSGERGYSRKNQTFDKETGKKQLNTLAKLEEMTGLPAHVDLVANSPEEMIAYLDFVMDNSHFNFSVDAYLTKVKVPACEHVRKRGMLDKLVYNSISLWEKDLDGEIKMISDIGVKHIILAPWDTQDDFSTGRIKGLEKLLEYLDRAGNPFESVIVDTSAMNLPTTMICNNAGTLIKDKYGFPCGTGAANGVYMWREVCQKMGSSQSYDLYNSGLPPEKLGEIKSFIAMDATTEAIASLGMDFVMYGPIENAPALFPAVAAAQANVAGMVLDQYKELPPHPDHPFNKLFPEMIEKFKQFQAGVEVERKWLPKGSAAKKGATK